MVYEPQYHSMFQNTIVSSYDTTNMHIQKVLQYSAPPPTEYHINTMVHEAKHQNITVLKVQ